jgi:hypothetical protein
MATIDPPNLVTSTCKFHSPNSDLAVGFAGRSAVGWLKRAGRIVMVPGVFGDLSC